MTTRITRRQALKIGAAAGVGLGTSLVLGRAYSYYIRPPTVLHRSPTPVSPIFQQSPTIPKFAIPLPGLGPAGIPTATAVEEVIAGKMTNVYDLGARQFTQQIVPAATGGPTTLWGYYDKRSDPTGAGQRYLGGAILATRGTPVLLQITNELPNAPVVPVDHTIMASATQTVGDLPINRIATHLHGGFTPWFSDGTPFQWYTPRGMMNGDSFMNVPAIAQPSPGTATYYYPLDQSARLMWYHDHAIGITRTNVYSGLAAPFVITDAFESGLIAKSLLPTLLGATDIPLVIQDKTFVSGTISADPTWQAAGGNTNTGSLWYPHVYEPNQMGGDGTVLNPPAPVSPQCDVTDTGRWDYGACVPGLLGNLATLPAFGAQDAAFYTLPTPTSAVAEAFLDTILINGAPYPTVEVPAERVRFRILNASNARFYHLNLYTEGAPGEAPVTLAGPAANPVWVDPASAVTASAGPIMYQIGNEGGFLPAVVVHDNKSPLQPDPSDTTGTTALLPSPTSPDVGFNLLLAPAERADIILDFNGQEGKSFILYNDAPAPFPGGDPRNDYFTGGPDQTPSGGAPPTAAGMGPNTRTLMQIKVSAPSTGDILDTAAWLSMMNEQLAANFDPGGQQPPPLHPQTFLPPTFGAFVGAPDRVLTLNEEFDEYGRLIQMLGTNVQNPTTPLSNQGDPSWGRRYVDPVTEGGTAQPINAGAVEVWQILNTTADTHPMHFHLVNVQVLQRQTLVTPIDPTNPLPLDGAPMMPPDDNERGWKETVRMNPGEATWVMMRFDLPALPSEIAAANVPSPRIGGHEYVWHCHILEHEEHDMMRPVVVTGTFPTIPAGTARSVRRLRRARRAARLLSRRDRERPPR